MHGCGNDYVYVNCFVYQIDDPESLAIRLSDRHFGVGGDGLVLICKSEAADARMRMFNLDGSEGNMCGNAIRCVAKYLYDNKMVTKDVITIETRSGVKTLRLSVENGLVASVRVDMGAPVLRPENIPVKLPGDKIVAAPVTVAGKDYQITCVSMGNPHAVVFCNDVAGLNLCEIGPLFEHHKLFPERVNTEFVKVLDKNTLEMRVWERGSGETLACGTGACATVVAATLNGFCKRGEDVRVKLIGGELVIRYTDETVFMTGPCESVFEGTITV
jgi:carbamoyl-phosphate synthase large subunit